MSPGPLDPTTIFPVLHGLIQHIESRWGHQTFHQTPGSYALGRGGKLPSPQPRACLHGGQATAIQEAQSLPAMAHGASVSCVETWRGSHRQLLPPQDPHMWNEVTPTLRAPAAHQAPNLRRQTGAGREAVSISPSSDSPPGSSGPERSFETRSSPQASGLPDSMSQPMLCLGHKPGSDGKAGLRVVSKGLNRDCPSLPCLPAFLTPLQPQESLMQPTWPAGASARAQTGPLAAPGAAAGCLRLPPPSAPSAHSLNK